MALDLEGGNPFLPELLKNLSEQLDALRPFARNLHMESDREAIGEVIHVLGNSAAKVAAFEELKAKKGVGK